MRYFETKFLNEAEEFLDKLDPETTRKIIYNIDHAELTNDPKLFKKLQNDIWEFRTKFAGFQIRLLAFWDKTESTDTVVVSTHGIEKKTDKAPTFEITKAENIRKLYFELKNKQNDKR